MRRILALSALCISCATTGVSGKGDENLPSEGVGPFRKLAAEEVAGIAPFVLDDKASLYREPATIVENGAVVLFAVATRDKKDVIVRTRANDGRSFFGSSSDFGRVPEVVLAPDLPWEGDKLSGPFVFRKGDELVMVYAAAGGIGIARSTNGRQWTKLPNPILVRDPAIAWETTELRGPGAYLLPDGRVRLLYASGNVIGEAESADGFAAYRRFDADPSTPAIDPVLVPSPAPAPGSLLPNEKPPFDTVRVADPSPTVKISPAGRYHVRVLYTGEGEAGATTIGFAGRYGESGPLERQSLPVYAVGAKEAAPALAETADGFFLYAQQNRTQSNDVFVAIAAGFAPAQNKLAPPAPFPDSP